MEEGCDIMNMDGYFEIQHFVHPEHPLILIDLKDSETRGLAEAQKKSHWEKRGLSVDKYDKLDVSIRCVLCHNEMMETSYSCTICDIHMHKLCSKLPAEMMHPSHTEHPLTLTDRRSFGCDICSETENGFSYCCHSCDFDVDVKCASRAEAFNHKGHPHPLYPFLRRVLFKCDACGIEHSDAAGGVSYMCNTCNFWVHENCATLPATVKYHRHVHPLSLVTRDSSIRRFLRRCAICKKNIHTNLRKSILHWLYECDGCSHEVHINCLATTLIAERSKTYQVDADIDVTKVFHLPESFQHDSLVAEIIKHMTIHYGGKNTAFSKVEGALICHFSHKHPLTLIHNDIPSINKEDVSCNACVLPISTTAQVPYYSCTECNNYALHEWCAKLPNELLQHPAHPHPLHLVGPGDEVYGFTRCPACTLYSNGFSYRCDTAACRRFSMDIKCLLPPAIFHKAHKHPLKLVQDCIEEGCIACPDRSRALAYGCVSCCFYLHHACALKPIIIVHRYDKIHPFTGTSVEPVENDVDDDYVCEFCEKDINPKWWFHHCLLCDLSACADCIFPEYGGKSHYNLRLTYSSNIHQHPLSYVQVDRTNNTSLCPTCQSDFRRAKHALRCAQCKVMFHIQKCSVEMRRGRDLASGMTVYHFS